MRRASGHIVRQRSHSSRWNTKQRRLAKWIPCAYELQLPCRADNLYRHSYQEDRSFQFIPDFIFALRCPVREIGNTAECPLKKTWRPAFYFFSSCGMKNQYHIQLGIRQSDGRFEFEDAVFSNAGVQGEALHTNKFPFQSNYSPVFTICSCA